LVGSAQTSFVLIFSRVLQGLGGALFIPSAYGLLFASFPQETQGWAIGMLGLAVGLGAAAGPTLSGFIIASLDWRRVFFMNVPLGILVIYLIHSLVEGDERAKAQSKIKLIDVFFSLPGYFFLCMYVINNFQWSVGLEIWILLTIAVLLLLVFVLMQFATRSNKLIDFTIFKNRQFSISVVGYTLYQYVFVTILVIVGIYLQNVINLAYPFSADRALKQRYIVHD